SSRALLLKADPRHPAGFELPTPLQFARISPQVSKQPPVFRKDRRMDQFAAMATFVRVVQAGSLSGAARSSKGSLTSVSRQVAALEAHFGVQLLLRTTRRLSLTEDGRLLYDRAKSILGELKEVELALSSGQR